MNVFENLIVELKEEKLLEQTVMDTDWDLDANDKHPDDTEDPSHIKDEIMLPDESTQLSARLEGIEELEIAEYDLHLGKSLDSVEVDIEQVQVNVPIIETPNSGQDFYRKRAIGEISNLQMVEHVLTGVEREYMKIAPNVFDDFDAKKTLNLFLRIAEDENSPEHQQAEIDLMRETETWCAHLANRDRKVPVSSLRQYCERSRPALSSQALIALARFYRNLPHSETVRAKFDFVITRLFTRPTVDGCRVSLFTPSETLNHINTLYREWSSIALYTADDDESKVLLTALSFEDLAIEAENARSFDHLLETDFFGRVRNFKSSISELFYAPNVTAAAIDANMRIGNAYVTLIDRERQKMDSESIQSKYGNIHDDSVSDGAARTMELGDLLRERTESDEIEARIDEAAEAADAEADAIAEASAAAEEKSDAAVRGINIGSPFVQNLIRQILNINKFLLGASVILIVSSFGVVIYSDTTVAEQPTSSGVRVATIEDPELVEYIGTARISGEIFYGILKPEWDKLPKEKRHEFVKKALDAGKEKGYTQVNLMTKNGKSVAFASPTRIEIAIQ